MKQFLLIFYHLEVENITPYKDNYLFSIQDNHYILSYYDRNIKDMEELTLLTKKCLHQNIFLHQIISNTQGSVITTNPENKQNYVLFQINLNPYKKTTLGEINFLSNIKIESYPTITRDNWTKLWESRNDYLEYQINQMGKKYPILVESFNYFIGLSENAISYVNHTIQELKPTAFDVKVLSHRKINNTIESLYNPLNLIIDYKIRDLAEYIKLSFFNQNKNIYLELKQYFSQNFISEFGMRLLFGRILYPSFYFEMYENAIISKQEEKSLLNLINRIDSYEEYLKDIFFFLKQYYNLPEVRWITHKK